ncbi:response regulator transcription factor [Paenibacillus sp. KACC 21273]|uniref:response regulator transcription factor n=1 Tax=Paenibacillus sp. KACC 21273 TaxID=3025665 RepID=UPI002366C532|nr:response regulator transcription factor [Paenibacillus sp. KACC 21273]WDF50447.1 response regulator transcription factor [Paenibacillus sp. KACC 21273]
MSVPSNIRIVLVDDQPIVRQGLQYIINAQSDMECVGEASNGHQALEVTLEQQPDMVLMDIQMPECSGLEATEQILRVLPDMKIVLLTTFDVQDYIKEGIRAGATGFLLKDADTQELLAGIRAVYKGEALYKTPLASKALAEALKKAEPAPLSTPAKYELIEPLTDQELIVLQQMAYGKRNSEIALALHISHGTVKTHAHRIFQKLNVEDRTQAVVLAIRQGLVK